MSHHRTLLVTGSNGLIGSAMVRHFHDHGWVVHGIDNNMRRDFFGPAGDTRWAQQRLVKACRRFTHHELDLRDRRGVGELVRTIAPSAVIHAAAQPGEELSAARPFDDFDVNAVGTLNVLQAMREWCPDAPLVHMSTNKVYGDAPNRIPLTELPTRWDYDGSAYAAGIDEHCSIDQSRHSVFGASKAAADLMVQEYGRGFGMPTACLRGGSLTAPGHSGVDRHEFLSDMVKVNMTGRTYTVFGHRGKQVRDNIHALDVARFAEAFIASPRCGEVYNIGGGRQNSCSILEAFARTTALTGRPMQWEYVDQARQGDHVCYITDLRKVREHYPAWSLTRTLDDIFTELVIAWDTRGVEEAV